MTMGRSMMRQARGRLAVCLCLSLTVMACRQHVERIPSGRGFTPDHTMWVASLPPSCGCISLENKTGKKVYLESTFYGVARGFMLIEDQAVHRVLFDWGGPLNSDRYELVPYEADAAGRPQRDRRLDAQATLAEFAPVAATACNDRDCAFGTLAMNRMLEAEEEAERDTARRGVNFSNVIEASAPLGQCGCMVLRNFSTKRVTLRSTLHGAQTGQITMDPGSTVPVPFDWSGNLDSDVYLVEAVDATSPDEVARALEPNMQAHKTAMTIRLKQFVEITGTFVGMQCTATESEFIVAGHVPADAAQVSIKCPWSPPAGAGLGMRVAFDERTRRLAPTPAGATGAGQ